MTTTPVLPPMLARMPEPGPIVISDTARRRLGRLMERYNYARHRAFTLREDAADLGQLVEAMRWDDIADHTWVTYHNYAAGVAGCSSDDQVDAVGRVRRQLDSEATGQSYEAIDADAREEARS